MLSTFQLICFFALMFVLPIALISLARGSPPPPGSFVAKYYRAEKYLTFVGDLMLVALCLTAAVSLTMHYGLVDRPRGETIQTYTDNTFFALFLLFVALWIKAIVKVRREGKKDETHSV